MNTPASFDLALRPHPLTPPHWAAWVQALRVRVQGSAQGLDLHYHVQTLPAQLAQLQWPGPSAQPGPRDGLWQRTCFEAFIGSADEGAAAYHEFNFSPSGDWAAYVFDGPRQRRAGHAPLPAPRCAFSAQADGLRLRAHIPAAALPPRAGAPGWALGLSAVLQDASGACSYWALRHPHAQPDFHARSGWAARWP